MQRPVERTSRAKVLKFAASMLALRRRDPAGPAQRRAGELQRGGRGGDRLARERPVLAVGGRALIAHDHGGRDEADDDQHRAQCQCQQAASRHRPRSVSAASSPSAGSRTCALKAAPGTKLTQASSSC